jgi:nitrite reductase/ring-hydroxylating ferredoxin subunit
MTLVRVEGPGVVESADGRRFVVLALSDGLRVVDARCPHNGGPLEQGWVRGDEGDRVLVCPWHWYRFDLDTGACDTSPQHVLGVHPVREIDGVTYADVGEPPRPMSWSERLRAHARE